MKFDPTTQRIIRNMIRCKRCGSVIESAHVHDFQWCSCGSVAVDGGRLDLQRAGTAFEELAIVEDRAAQD